MLTHAVRETARQRESIDIKRSTQLGVSVVDTATHACDYSVACCHTVHRYQKPRKMRS